MSVRPPKPTAWVLALITTGAFALRVFLTWPSVFGQDYVAFVENDAWYHMRLVDALVREFPWRIWHDPYLVHPGGEAVNAGPVLDWIIAAAALVLGAGSPSPRLVDVVGAYVPPILGALTVVPVYVLGRELFSRRAGLWAALMVAVMPGQLLQRSLLGYTDHHCAEVLLSTTALMFVVVALRDPPNPSRRRRYAVAAGFGLGTYLLTWGGGVLFVAILVTWVVLQVFLDAFRDGESDDVVSVVVPTLLIAAVMVAPWTGTRPPFAYQFGSLVGGAMVIWALHFSRRVAQRYQWTGTVWVAIALGSVCASAALALVVMGDNRASLITDALRVSPFRPRDFIVEAQPLMASEQWRPVPLWTEFTSSLVLAIAGTGMLLGRVRSGHWSSRTTLLGCWTATTILATFGQVRFAYYLAVNVALIGGFTCDRAIEAVGAIKTSAVSRALAACVVMCLVILPGVPILRPIRNASAALNANWYDALMWMGANTPEPFRDPTRYYRSSPTDSAESDYGVLALWDYGYWITRVARRVPVTNPRQTGVRDAADFLLSSNELDANRLIDRLGARYVAVDWRLAAPSTISDGTKSVFNGVVRAAGRNPPDYCGLFSAEPASTATPTKLLLYCYPEYFRTMAMRLYQYGGRAATPENVVVVSFRREIQDRVSVHIVTREWNFISYEEADRFVTTSGRTDVKIVSKHPLKTCVPLEALTSYTPVFKSLERFGTEPAAAPLVQVFEYRPPRDPSAAAGPPR